MPYNFWLVEKHWQRTHREKVDNIFDYFHLYKFPTEYNDGHIYAHRCCNGNNVAFLSIGGCYIICSFCNAVLGPSPFFGTGLSCLNGLWRRKGMDGMLLEIDLLGNCLTLFFRSFLLWFLIRLLSLQMGFDNTCQSQVCNVQCSNAAILKRPKYGTKVAQRQSTWFDPLKGSKLLRGKSQILRQSIWTFVL